MAERRNRVKEFLDRSPWALGAVVIAAVLSFLLSAVDQGWRLYERVKAPEPALSAIEIVSQRGFEMVETTEAQGRREVRTTYPVYSRIQANDKQRAQ